MAREGEVEDSRWKGSSISDPYPPPSPAAKPWYLGFFFHPNNSQTGQIWDMTAPGSCPKMRGKGLQSTKSFEFWRQTGDKANVQCCEWRPLIRVVVLHFAFIILPHNLVIWPTFDFEAILNLLFCWEFPILHNVKFYLSFCSNFFFSSASMRPRINAGRICS